jgi:tRNA (guanine-N7-)-methyltransferase
MTAAQQRALETLLPRWGVPPGDEPLALDDLFGRRAQRVLDIGFGDGEALLTAAANHPHIDYLGIEVHEPGVGHLLLLVERARLTNVRVAVRDAVEVVEHLLPDASFDAINLFFPDPWPKKRHHKRRIVQTGFLAHCSRVLKDGGLMHLATDWIDYAEHSLQAFAASPELAPETGQGIRDDALAFRAPTKFERRGVKLGHEIVDLYFRKRADARTAAEHTAPSGTEQGTEAGG